jgi:hypothetical protein
MIPKMANDLPSICYLCEKPLLEPIGLDHAPPKQLFAKKIRKAHSLQLLTIPVHDACNKSYQHDEDYFVHTLMPFAPHSYAGKAIYDEVLRKFRSGEKIGLTKKVLNEFERRPSGLVLPENIVIKRFEGHRIQRIAWKIVRGLYFHHSKNTFPENLITGVTVTSPDQKPPEHFIMFMSMPDNESHGLYPAVFAYRFQKFFEGEHKLHYWALLLWDRIIITVIFHDPTCECVQCCDREVK